MLIILAENSIRPLQKWINIANWMVVYTYIYTCTYVCITHTAALRTETVISVVIRARSLLYFSNHSKTASFDLVSKSTKEIRVEQFSYLRFLFVYRKKPELCAKTILISCTLKNTVLNIKNR